MTVLAFGYSPMLIVEEVTEAGLFVDASGWRLIPEGSWVPVPWVDFEGFFPVVPYGAEAERALLREGEAPDAFREWAFRLVGPPGTAVPLLTLRASWGGERLESLSDVTWANARWSVWVELRTGVALRVELPHYTWGDGAPQPTRIGRVRFERDEVV